MRIRSILGALMVCLLMAIPAMAQDLSLEERVKRLEQQQKEKEEQEKRERAGMPAGVERPEVMRRQPANQESERCRKLGGIFVRRNSPPCLLVHPAQVAWSMLNRSSQRQRPLSAAIWTFNIVPRAKPVSRTVMEAARTGSISNGSSRLFTLTLPSM